MGNNLIEELKNIVYKENDEEHLNLFLSKHEKELLEIDPILLIGYHVDFYLQKDQIKKGLDVLNYYKSKPYISMTVEDFMNELYEKINDDAYSNNNSNRNYTKLDLEKDLFSDSFDKKVFAIKMLSNMNVRNYLDIVNKFFLENKDDKLNRILIIVLVEQNISETFKCFIGGVNRIIKPSEITLPFEEKQYKEIIEYINNNVKNPDSLNRLVEIFSSINVMSFPDKLFKNYDNETIFNVLLRIEKESLGYKTESSSSSYENSLFDIVYPYCC